MRAMTQPAPRAGVFNEAQYRDFLAKSKDGYADTKWDIILDYLAGAAGLDVLNVGCGSGELSFRLARAGHRVTGIDPVVEYVRLARRNAELLGAEGCSFEVAAVEEYKPGRLFDSAVSTDVLEHIEDDRRAFEHLARLVKPGGLIVLAVPAGQWLFGYHDETLGHHRRYSKRTLRALVRDWCAVDRVRYFGFSLIPVCLLYSKWLRKPYPVAEAGDSQKSPFPARVLNSLLRLDRAVPMPLGTSLVLRGVRK